MTGTRLRPAGIPNLRRSPKSGIACSGSACIQLAAEESHIARNCLVAVLHGQTGSATFSGMYSI